MLENKEAILEVARYCEETDAGASCHWRFDDQDRGQHPLRNDPFDFTYGPEGFSAIGPIGAISTKRNLAYRTAHRILQLPLRVHGYKFDTFGAIDQSAALIAKRQGRVYDKDLLRHSLTLAFLLSKLDIASESDPIAVIGDGFGNMTSLILAHLPKSRVIIVNLTKTLLVDMAFAHKALPEVGIALVRNGEEMDEAVKRTNIRLIAVCADQAELLTRAPIALGINILSMMEMDASVTKMYFDALRQCPRTSTAFYCCNKIEKQLTDESVTRFFEYPWDSGDEVLVDDLSPWDKYGYHGTPPFYYRNKPIQHRLVHLKKVFKNPAGNQRNGRPSKKLS
ncbi:MAG: putative sugar O-methyltransferase [Alphaproteobacteria bacterium]|jgi:hypothetical protein|nr:putative sugar O-methyltransferase [Alphaproteobacteria bacterium]